MRSREGSGTPLQCSCLENPRDGGAWWAAVYGVAQSRTRLKWLSSSSDKKSWLICKDPDAGKDWGQEEKGMTEDEIVGWHHRLNGHGFGWTQGIGDGQGGLACCRSWGRKESDMTERLNWTELRRITETDKKLIQLGRSWARRETDPHKTVSKVTKGSKLTMWIQ